MNFKKINNEVYYSQDLIVKVSANDINFLKLKAAKNSRKRVRLCAHNDILDSLHEMLIIHARNNYVQPHQHLFKSESFHIIEGRLLVVIFDEKGQIVEVIEMGDISSNDIFYYRLSKNLFHTIIPLTEWVVFHETTKGPFLREETVFAPWAPEDEDDQLKKRDYLDNLLQRLSGK